jgi:hypothetical protein
MEKAYTGNHVAEGHVLHEEKMLDARDVISWIGNASCYGGLYEDAPSSLSGITKEEMVRELSAIFTTQSEETKEFGWFRNFFENYERWVPILLNQNRESDANFLVEVLRDLQENRDISYLFWARSRRLLSKFKGWEEKSAEEKFLMLYEQKPEHERSGVVITPGVEGYYDDGRLVRIVEDPEDDVDDTRYYGYDCEIGTEDIFLNEMDSDFDHRVQVREDYFLLRDPKLFNLLPKTTRFLIESLPIPEQAQLAHLMRAHSVTEFEKIESFIKQFGRNGARTFIFQEADKKIGADIMGISEKVQREDAEKLFSLYSRTIDLASSIRNNVLHLLPIREWVGFNPPDTNEWNFDDRELFVNELRSAILERATDILYAIQSITEKGIAECDFYGGKHISVSSIDEVLSGLDTFVSNLDKISLAISLDQEKPALIEMIGYEEGHVESFSLKASPVDEAAQPFYVTIQLREEPTNEPDKEREYDGESRVNFLVSNEEIPLKTDNPARLGAFSLRLDREGIVRDGDRIVLNDPTLKEGSVALDIGSFDDVVGKVISIGNALGTEYARKRTTVPEYYHNRSAFREKFGEIGKFGTMVAGVRKHLQHRFGIGEL